MFEDQPSEAQLKVLNEIMFNMAVFVITIVMDVKGGHPAVRHRAMQIVNIFKNIAEPVQNLQAPEFRKQDVFNFIFALTEIQQEILKLEFMGYEIEVDNFHGERTRMSEYLAQGIEKFAETIG